MTQFEIPAEVAAIEKWLESELFEIGLHCLECDPYEICAVRKQDGHEFELNIECNYWQGIVLLTVKCMDEITTNKYLFLLQLLNYINVNEEQTKITLDPSTMKICCTNVISLFSENVDPDEIMYRLETNTSWAMRDMAKIRNVLRENIGLKEAVRIMIGDTSGINHALR